MLLLGYYGDDGKLIYAGRAGTGMTDAELHALVKRVHPLASDKMPLAAPPPKNTRGKPLVLSRVHWVRPELVVEVGWEATRSNAFSNVWSIRAARST